ncbi:MAG: ATP-dependent DNA helicase RecQ, partial [Desulfocapsaceae bacterium]|nr:ATP-dependent DNA helicase RecQ [Desulfocapsaceae bacterium]
MNYKEQLQRIFGFSTFRANQEEIVQAILAGRDVFAVMPTGGGKSLCYQLPASMITGTCLVISPLISLMKDQVDAANAFGMQAGLLNSTLSTAEQHEVLARLQVGAYDLLYLSPERLALPGFLERLRRAPLSFVAVDEAHCISEWGHDFRPDYLALSRLKQELPGVPLTAFTATATHKVQEDIVRRLSLAQPLMTRASFDRPNLFYQVQLRDQVNSQIEAVVHAHPDEAGIVYRLSRADVEKTAAWLQKKGIKALPYHAGLDNRIRKQNQEAFNRDEVQVVVATVAFGMGIDKSNVRFVIHGDLP